MTDIKAKFTKAIETTGNPMAPIILQEAYARAEALGKMFVPITNYEQMSVISDRLLKDFTDEELNSLCVEPVFIVALCGMLVQSLHDYGSRL